MDKIQPIIDTLNVISANVYQEAVAMMHYKGVLNLSFCAVFALLIILHATIFQRKILTFLGDDVNFEKWVLIIVIYLILALFFLGTLFSGIDLVYFPHCEALKYLLK